MHQDWSDQHSKAMSGSSPEGPGPWSEEPALEFTGQLSAKKPCVPFPALTAFSSPLEILMKPVLLLLLWVSNANIIVAPRGLEWDPIRSQQWVWAKVSALPWQQSLVCACRGTGGIELEETPVAAREVHTSHARLQIPNLLYWQQVFTLLFHNFKKSAGKKSYRMQHKAEGKIGRW